MSKLYVGNLPSDCNESALRQLFQEHSLACTTILVKRGGYAFVDCADQSTADRAIDKLNGYTYLGSSLVVEPSVASAAKKRSTVSRTSMITERQEQRYHHQFDIIKRSALSSAINRKFSYLARDRLLI
ncbi:PREDICTED: insulin-like growth factor 2 mRNA-binding protein 3-A [Wasmannia auropunctata]|uniref:insulin-like growth factor 2 mRNA-binding protein 3-A n=1 Tax=Wasmannia auropunctata TaxID=64793 RepID=UPI0005ED4529|nr:PREDICTED: insulin-like growth factor 2 mRNA-binding protein 3-A [Wasmannia auropunctata]